MYHKFLWQKGVRRIPEYLGDCYINSNLCIMSDYLEMSIEEYLVSPDRKLSNTEICLQMLKSIEEIHNAGYIHRDIKPDNFRIHDH